MNDSTSMTRREALQGLAAGALSLAALEGVLPRPAGAEPVKPSIKQILAKPVAEASVVPLPFDAKRLNGLSEKIMTSHHQNNYGGAVKRLNAIRQRVRGLPAEAQPFELGALKREELLAQNSAVLHELYFGNLGGKGEAGGDIAAVLKHQFGDMASWEQEFRKTAQSLGGGSGWVILAYEPHHGRLMNVWSWDHLHSLAGGVPLLVLDMYEHAYHMDYGANAKAYIDAFFKNIEWRMVEQRLLAAAR